MLEIIVDEEITLRQFAERDADAIFSLIDRNREHLSQNEDDTANKYRCMEDVLKSIQKPRNPEKLRFGIWVGDSLVGSVNMTPDLENGAEIGYYLGNEFTKKGYMGRSVKRLVRYGFEEKKLDQIYARVHRDNEGSMAVLVKVGFSRDVQQQEENYLWLSMYRLDFLKPATLSGNDPSP